MVGAVRLSGLQVGNVPQGAGHRAYRGGACYIVGMLAVFLFPDNGEKINTYVTIPSAIAELSMVLYLLAVGVKTPKPTAAQSRGVNAGRIASAN